MTQKQSKPLLINLFVVAVNVFFSFLFIRLLGTQISKTKFRITSLTTQIELATKSLKESSVNISSELDLFHTIKASELKEMVLCFAKAQRDHHEQALNAWKQVKSHIEAIRE